MVPESPSKSEGGRNWLAFAKEVFELQNKVRKDPRSFINHLQR